MSTGKCQKSNMNTREELKLMDKKQIARVFYRLFKRYPTSEEIRHVEETGEPKKISETWRQEYYRKYDAKKREMETYLNRIEFKKHI